ncbi:MAG: CRISPR system precrRNA processing endoribonuclease RAMP protein Cas6 [Bryobacteraceae bacterium]
MYFSLQPARFSFRAVDPVYFPPGKAGNVLRGGFGLCLRATAAPEAYSRIFEPAALGGPSGLVDAPRPFVFRAAHLDGMRVSPGAEFGFDLHLFGGELEPYRAALVRLGEEGFGPGRGRARLVRVESREVRVCLEAERASRLRVRFLTPTELKADEGLAAWPEFGVLFGRARDRVATLARLYGSGAIECDFRGMGERARDVAMTACRVAPVEVERRSARTGQTHAIGGFVGEAEYEGTLGEFVPWLRAAAWTGVGRQTVWGKGAIAVDVLDAV